MIKSLRYIWQLLVLSSLVLLAGILVIQHFSIQLQVNLYLITVGSITLINLISFMIMGRAVRRENQSGVVVLLAGVGIKFLLYLLFVLLIWLVTKNLNNAFIITFFALYLIFTFFLAIHLLKLLNTK
jgi:hypothetical protein